MLILGSSFSVQAQKQLIGIAEDKMFSVNPVTGQATQIRTLSQDFTGCASMVFLPHIQKFYTVSRIDNKNLLIGITIDGKIDTIGSVTIPGETVYSVETIAYRTWDCGVFISASLDGGSAQSDWAAETIVHVDIETAVGTVVTEYQSSAPKGGDADVMEFWNDTLFFVDADPSNYFYIHKTTFRNLPSAITPPQVYYESRYYPIGDMVQWNNIMYFTADYGLYWFDPKRNPISFTRIGTTHSNSLASSIYMMALYDPVQPKFEIRDTSICDTSKYSLTAPANATNVRWSTGETSRSIQVTATGEYYVNYKIDDCLWSSDTATITLVDCDSCWKKRDLYKDSLSLGNDTVVCDGDPFLISVDIDGADRFVWGNGTTGKVVYADRTDSYHVSFWIGDCQFFSDTVHITFIKCDTCDRIRLEALAGLSLDRDHTVCRGELVDIDIGSAPGFVGWSDGETSRQRSISASGEFWALFDTAGCTFNSDTFSVQLTNCEICQFFIPNAFAPDGHVPNEEFGVWIDTVNCDPEVEMMIFNRWGEKVFHRNNEHWDGTYLGEDCQMGVYMYILNISYPYQGREIRNRYNGTFHLIR